jgi:amino acid adenylation domain-containing protein
MRNVKKIELSIANGLQLGKSVTAEPLTIHQCFERQVVRCPRAIAVVDGATRLSYAELNDSANRLARHLTTLGVGPEVMVGICLGRSYELIVAILAVLKAAGAYVPLDPDYPTDRLSFMMRDAALPIVITKASTREQLTFSESCRVVCLDAERANIEEQSSHNLTNSANSESLLYVIYTSGSTGQPKGVMVTHHNVVRLFDVLAPILNFSADDVWSFYHSPAFGYSAWEIWGALVHGGRLVIVPPEARIAPTALREFLKKEAVSVLSLTPSAFRQIMLDSAFASDASVHTLRMIALSGEGVVGADLGRWFACHREDRPEIVDTYAITETGGQVAWRKLRPSDVEIDASHMLGKVLSDLQVHLLDAQLLPVQPGADGELCISGPGLARGYWKRPDLTRDKFVQDPLNPKQRLYRTGDRGRLRPDGRIMLLGRGDDQVKVRGFRVELGEIEAQLREHSQIREAAVVLREDVGEAPRLVAYIVESRLEEAERARASKQQTGEPELWPSLGEYQVYDEVLYSLMTLEPVRNAAYKEAIQRHVKDKIVLDIGTGQHAILARFSVEAGAKRIYAIEVLDDAFEKAAKLVQEAGLSDRITVIHGDSTTVELPELVDVCTEGIIGNIGSSDGIIPIMNDARRWFSPNAIAIPNRCITYFAAVQLPDSLYQNPRFGSLPGRYVERIFSQAGRRFDIRLCVRNFPASSVISSRGTFEDLDFSRPIDPEEDGQTTVTIAKPGRLDGLLLWTHVTTTDGVAIDYLHYQQAWLPVYFPLSDEGVDVQVDDKIQIRWERTLCANGINPDYFVQATVIGSRGRRADLQYRTKHHETAYLATRIHRQLFGDDEQPPARLAADALRAHLETRLPDYMIPSTFVFLAELPRNANGKLDRKRLPEPDTQRPDLGTPFAKPETPLQEEVAAIWTEVLKVDAVGLDDRFFDLGGHSLIAAQIMARIAAKVGVELPLSTVADHPTVRRLTDLIEREKKEPFTRSSVQAAPQAKVPTSSEDEYFMRLTIEQAAKGQRTGGVPFAACVVKEGQIVARVHNCVAHSRDLTAHAEILALRAACETLRTTVLSGCEIYSTCEPCPMCFAACHEARISRIIHGAWLRDAELCGLGTLSIPAEKLRQLGRASLTLTPGVLRNEVLALLEAWKKQRAAVLEVTFGETRERRAGLYNDDEGFEAYTKAVASSDLLDQAMNVLRGKLKEPPVGQAFRFLDIGAGTGVLTLRVLQDLAARGALPELDYLEPSDDATRLLQARIKTADLGHTLGRHYGMGWEEATELVVSTGKRYDLILAHHSLYYAPLSNDTVRPLSSLLAPGGCAFLFMDAEQSPVALIREIAGRHLGRKEVQLSGSRDLENQLVANELKFERLELNVTWDISSLFKTGNGSEELKRAMTAFLALIPPAEITDAIERLVSEEARSLSLRDGHRWFLKQQSRVFILPSADEPEAAQRIRESPAPALVPAPEHRNEPFPLTEIQAAYWIGRESSLQLGNVATHVYEEIECLDLDIARLERAWHKLIDRHDMLRAIIQPDGRLKVLAQVPTFRIALSDLSQMDEADAQQELPLLRHRMSHQVRKSEEWPPFEIRAVRLDARRVRLLMSYDVIFIDGWSRAILFSEWKKLYQDLNTALPTLELTFRDYVLAASRVHDSEAFRRAREYWRRRLTGLPPAPRLPLACDPTTLKEPRFNRYTTNLRSEQWTALKLAAGRSGVTPSCFLLAAFSDVLHRWSEEPGFCLNLSLFNREPLHPQVNDIVGDFTSVILLQVEPPDKTFEERAQRLQRQLWRDLDHRQFSGIEVLRELARQRSDEHALGMPVVFTSLLWNDSTAGDRSVAHWLGEQVYGVSQTPQVWLDCVVYESHGSLVLLWDVVEALFPKGMVETMFDTFVQSLVNLTAEKSAWQQTWSETAWQLIPSRQLALFDSSNATTAPVADHLLDELFTAQARRSPDQAALITTNVAFTYAQIDNLADALAVRLRNLLVRPNSLVAVVMGKGWEQIVAVLAILKAGAAYLPIDASLPAERILKLLTHGQVRIALTQERHLNVIKWPEAVQPIAIDATPAAPSNEIAALEGRSPSDLAYVIYTSGSTGEPKGVVIDHRGAINTILDINNRFGIQADDRVLALSSLSFDLSVYDIFGTLAAGATIVMPDTEGTRDPAHWVDLINRHSVTIWNSVPSLMELLIDYVRHRPERHPRSLKLVMLSGDWISVALPEAIRRVAATARIVSLGGATEASIWSILYPIGVVKSDWASIPYGRAMLNQTFQVLSTELAPCPVWVPGELYIGGIGLAKGYWRDTERSQASFFTHPRTGDRLYRTGDIGRYLPDGNIEFLGRKDTQVKIQGYRAELGEIEATLSRHPDVAAVAVIAKGQRYGGKHLVAYVVTSGNRPVLASELQAFLREKLPDYMVPATYVMLDAMPLTANGKVNRQALPEPPEPTSSSREGTPEHTNLERMRELVVGVLGQTDLDGEANLLECGANSIDMIRIVNRIDEALGFRPRIGDLYRNPTIAGLTRSYEEYRSHRDIQSPERTVPALPNGAFQLLTDPAERETFKRTQAGLRQFTGDTPSVAIALATDEITVRQYALRRSHRNFSSAPVPFAQLSRLFASLSPIPFEGHAKYMYGSAGSSYSVQTYIYAKLGRVDSLPAGAYYYEPVERRFVLISGGACIDPETYDFLINRPVFEAAAFAVFFVAQLAAIEPLYGKHALSFATLEAGLMTQLLEMTAPSYSIGLCQIGGLDEIALHKPLAFQPGHILLHSLVGGPIEEPEAQLPGSDVSEMWMEGEI